MGDKGLENMRRFICWVLGKLGIIPVALIELLDDRDDYIMRIERPRTIDINDIISWHDWGNPEHDFIRNLGGENLVGWTYLEGRYKQIFKECEELKRIGSKAVSENWKTDILAVEGLAASKSNLKEFTSLDAMVKKNSQEMINPVTKKKFCENIGYSEIRIIHQEVSYDYFSTYLWDARLFLNNNGGSHHFAAARYIARKLDIPYELTGQLRVYKISSGEAQTLQEVFEMIALPNIDKNWMLFHEAMESFKSLYYLRRLPSPEGKHAVVFLPKENARSIKVANVMKRYGLLDIGSYLQDLVRKQDKYLREVGDIIDCGYTKM